MLREKKVKKAITKCETEVWLISCAFLVLCTHIFLETTEIFFLFTYLAKKTPLPLVLCARPLVVVMVIKMMQLR